MSTTMSTTIHIRDTAHYDEVVERMLTLEEQPDSEHNEELNMLAQAIKDYDDNFTPEPTPPITLRGLLEVEMSKRKLKQRGLALLLEIPETRLSEMMKGKRDMSIDLARKIFTRLHVPADTILTLQG